MTCDNASNNDTMTTELNVLLPAFSSVNRTRCFAHILNLIAKSILKLFDIPKPKKKAGVGDELANDEPVNDGPAYNDPELDDDERELLELAGDIDEEELTTRQENDADDDDEDDDEEDWVDEMAELTEDELRALKTSILPISRVLVKVSADFGH